MMKQAVSRLLVAAPQGVAAKLRLILSSAGLDACTICTTGGEALSAAQGEGLLLTTYRLPDMTGEELAQKMGSDADVLMIVPQDYDGATAQNVMTLRNPVSQDALLQSVRVLMHCRARIESLREKAQKLERTLEERKVIDRAKGKLMDTLHLTESEAHYQIQKKSMDSGRRIVEIAQEILDGQEIIAS